MYTKSDLDAPPPASAYTDPEDRLAEAIGLMKDMRAYAEETFQLWEANQNFLVGKRLRAMAGALSNYDTIPAVFNDFIIKHG